MLIQRLISISLFVDWYPYIRVFIYHRGMFFPALWLSTLRYINTYPSCS